MNPSEHQEQEVYNAAVALPPDRRAAYLDKACGGDLALRHRVEALLKVEKGADAFFASRRSDEDQGTKVLPARPSPYPGIRVRYFGDYELIEEIARGGMGVVWKARQVSLNRIVALKMILAGEFATGSDVRRFQVEAEAAANLDHPNIVPIFEVGEHQGQHYFSMKFVEGGSLSRILPEYTKDLRKGATLMAKVARAVHHAHQRGVLHRDLKPGNILIDEHGEPHVTDFGLAKLVHADTGLTQTDAIMGTPSYMAPEQAAGKLKQLSTSADIFSLGVILYQLLTGKLPFGGETPLEIMRQVMEQEPERPSTVTRAVDRDVETICLKCLEKETQARYGSAQALAEELERWLRQEPILARPASSSERLVKWIKRRPAIAAMSGALLVVALAGILSVLWQSNEAVKARGLADANAKLADQQRVLAETTQTNLYRLLYIADMKLAKRAWDESDVSRVLELLDLHRPQAGRPDLRGFEWFYLHRLCHSDFLSLEGHPEGVVSVAFSPDGQRLASAGWDGTMKLWDLSKGRELFTVTARTKRRFGEVAMVVFSPDGSKLAWANGDDTLKLWDATSGEERLSLKGSPAQVVSAAFGSDGKRLASGCVDGTIKIWDTANGQAVLTLKGHTDVIFSLAFSPDGKRLASSGIERTVRLWDTASGKEVLVLNQQESWVTCVAFSPDGRLLASSSLDDIKLWDAVSGKEIIVLKPHAGAVTGVAFSPDGKWLASASWDKTVHVRSLTGDQELTLKGHLDFIMGVAFSPDGRQVASAGADRTVKIWNVISTQEPLAFKVPTSGTLKSVPSPDGTRLASAAEDRKIELRSADGQQTLILKGHSAPITCLAFSPDGSLLATAAGVPQIPQLPGELKIWEVLTGREKLTLKGHIARINSLAFSPNGKRLASVCDNHAVKIWDVVSGQETLTLQQEEDCEGLAFSPDGNRLVSNYANGAVKIWDATPRKQEPPQTIK